MDDKVTLLKNLLIENLEDADLDLNYNTQLMLLTTFKNIIPNIKKIIETSGDSEEKKKSYEKKLVELASKFDEEIKTYDKEKLNVILETIFCILTYVSVQNDLFKQAYLQNLLVDNKLKESIFDKIFYALIPACATDESNKEYNEILETINPVPGKLYDTLRKRYKGDKKLAAFYKSWLSENTRSRSKKTRKSKKTKTGGKKRRKRSKKMYY